MKPPIKSAMKAQASLVENIKGSLAKARKEDKGRIKNNKRSNSANFLQNFTACQVRNYCLSPINTDSNAISIIPLKVN